jgi:DNA mismatch repair protein MutL
MTIEPRITLLDDNTANQIAAGEVVERPASVVKELVENSIDAGARHIQIELEEAGKYLVRVTDDGCGMGQEDAILCLQRHATSKIHTADDLFSIATMGFRGDAIPSIASVSHFTLVTKAADSPDDTPGTEIRVIGGQIESIREVGARPGTSITVENLFYNVPARLKFLKTSATELNRIVELVQRFALAHPATSFRLTHHRQEVFASAGRGTLSEACLTVFGRDMAKHLVPVDYSSAGGVRVTGFLGTPQALKSNRSYQHTFVNRRFIRDKAVVRALDEGYSSVQTLHGQKYPMAVLMIEIDPSQVDVNVSPTKTEVRFTVEREVFSAVYHAVQNALIQQGGLVASITEKLASRTEEPAFAPAQQELMSVLAVPAGRAYSPHSAEFDPFGDQAPGPCEAHLTPRPPSPPAPLREGGANHKGSFPDPNAADITLTPPGAGGEEQAKRRGGVGLEHRNTLAGLRVLAQTRNMYIVAQTGDALLLIDQHIAHERVLYERLLAGHGAAQLAVQRLVIPITLELGRREALVVQSRLEELAKAGFELEPFGGDSFLVRAVPARVAQKQSPEKVVRAIIDELVEKTVSRKLMVPAEEVLITASCKMAVKAGDPLSLPEMEALVADLLVCENPYTCPHGRPIIVELPNNDLDRRFGRI